MAFNKHALDIDPAAETERIVTVLRQAVGRRLRRFGAVVGISGGVDSSVVMALCARAFGAERVVAVMMPEKDSDPLSAQLARKAAQRLGITPLLEVLTPVLDGFGCYERRDAAICRVFPEYDAARGYKAKIVLPDNLLDENTLNVFSLVVLCPDGREMKQALGVAEYLHIVAASNFKQRTRMSMLYYHAELRNYAVIGKIGRA